LPDQLIPIDTEQRPGPQIGFHNHALRIQREMTGWGKLVKFHVSVARRFEFCPRSAELVVPHFQFNLMGL
jgi:hypothetical protein